MSDAIAEIKASFFIECEELLEALQDGLQEMESPAPPPETVNVVFRAVHSIKGGAGAFGLDALVGFAHKFENVLDEVRAGRLTPDAEMLKLFFTCVDLLSDLVRESRDELPHDQTRIEDTTARLVALGGADEPEPADEEVAFEAMSLDFDLDLGDDAALDFSLEGEASPPPAVPANAMGAAGGADGFSIAFAPRPELQDSGNEPLFLLRGLSELGTATIRCDDSAVPELESLDPAEAHLRWHIALQTDRARDEVLDIFEFVEGLCELDIALSTQAEARPQPAATPAKTPDHRPETPTLAGPPPAPQSAPACTSEPVSASTAAAPSAPTRGAAPTTVRVDLERIDRLVNLVGELVINQAMLNQSADAAMIAPHAPLRAGLEELLQLTRNIQDSVMMIRAQPVKSLYQRMGRIVREAAAATGKEVSLRTIGENTEVDKTLIERLTDPLTHMVRNAIDHGLESPEARQAAGKPAIGSITLSAMHQSGRVLIEVSDDGAGIDRARVRGAAEAKGLIEPGAELSVSDIDNLLFMPGFSTAEQISNLSGRGVGLDVVGSAIQEIGGRVSISSIPGEGTTFKISLPLTLAVLDGMVIEVGAETLVAPLNAIVETHALGPDDIHDVSPGTRAMWLRDGLVPLIDLGAHLAYRPPLQSFADRVALVVALDAGERVALVCDRIVDQRQVVIKGLHESYGHVPGIAAATILGDGHIGLILDPADLVSAGKGRRAPRALATVSMRKVG